ALCRPTLWAFASLAACVVILQQVRRGLPSARTWRTWGVVVITCLITVAPWVIRNEFIFGEPILTTTHGGYTLLLGNNEQAYREEVEKPFGILWDSRPWQQSLADELRQAGLAPADELARDRWMSRRAWNWIGQHPREFAAACWLRVRRFWN